MKKHLLWILLLGCTLYSFANPKIDSLKTVLKRNITIDKKINTYRDIGYAYLFDQVYYDSAYTYCKKAHTLAKISQRDTLITQTLFDLATVFLSSDYPDDALLYYNEALGFAKELEIDRLLAATYNNIGGIHFDKQLYVKATQYYDSSLVHAKKINAPYSIAVSYLNTGEVLQNQKKYYQAESKILQALRLFNSIKEESTSLHLILARTYFETNRDSLALVEAKKGLQVSTAKNDLKYIFEHYRLLAQIASKNKDFRNASTYFKQSLLYNDSILKAKKEHEVEKVLLKYKVQQQEEQVAILTSKNRYLNTIYILVFFGVLLIGLLISRQLKIKKMTQSIYEAQHQFVSSKSEEQKEKEISAFEATVAGDKEFKKKNP